MRCPHHPFRGYIVGPRAEGCTCERFPLTKERPANRWAAFTDDELVRIDEWHLAADEEHAPLGDADYLLVAEIRAEIDRRRA